MATITGWARRLLAANPVVSVMSTTEVLYEPGSSIPRCLTLRFNDDSSTEMTVRFLEINLTPDEVRKLGDACVGFLSKLEA